MCGVCISSPLHTHSLDMRHTALFSQHEIRGFTLTTRECIGIASIEVQEAVASLCLPGDDVHTLSEITEHYWQVTSYDPMAMKRRETSLVTVKGDLPTELSLHA